MALFFSDVSSCCGMFLCSVCQRFLLNALTCALDPGAYFLSESSVLPPSFLAACFRVNLCPQLLDRILFPILSMCIQSAAPTIQGCRCHWGSRPPPRNGRGCSLFLVTNTFALHHVTIRFGSLPLHVFRYFYLGALSNFHSPCPQRCHITHPQTSYITILTDITACRLTCLCYLRTLPALSRVHVPLFLPRHTFLQF